MHKKVQLKNRKGRDPLRDLGVDGRLLIKWSAEKYVPVTGFYEHDNDYWGSIKIVNFLTC
jgi:hypothetical protein